MPPITSSARLGAAAFALGLSLAGPQALGVAAADAPADSAQAATSSGPAAQAAATPRRGVAPGRGNAAKRGSAPQHSSPASDGASAKRAPDLLAMLGAPVRPASASAPPSHRSLAAAAPTPPRLGLASAALSTAPAPTGLQAATAEEVAAAAPVAARGEVPLQVAASHATAIPLELHAQLQAAVQKVETQTFNRLMDNLIQFAGGSLGGRWATDLEGALSLLRRRWFNDGPQVTPSPQTTSDDGTVQGRIGAFDPAGNALSYAVTSDPNYGTVEVSPDGTYSFTPGAQFNGTDSFTVKITPQGREQNILNPSAAGPREVTINIGTPTVVDTPDFAVNLSDTAGRITVKRGVGGQYLGTVTLSNVTDTTPALWLDTSGKFGSISAADLASNFQIFKSRAAENGATPDVTLAYSDADGTQQAVLLKDVDLKVNSAGEYVFTGHVAPDPAINPTKVDIWDVEGKQYKAMFDAFLHANHIGVGQFGGFKPVSVDFTGGDFYASTLTPLSYQQDGLYAYNSESTPQAGPSPSPSQAALASSTAYQVAAAANTPLSPVTAVVTVGDTAYVGRANGSLESWTDGQKTVLSAPGAWGYGDPRTKTNPVSVTVLTPYNRELTDLNGTIIPSTFTGYIEGTTLTVTGLGAGSTVVVGSVISGAGVAPGTIITKFQPQTVSQNSCSQQSNSCTGSTPTGGVNGSLGVYEVSIAQNVGAKTAVPTDGQIAAPAGIAFTQTSLSGQTLPASVPSVVVGLSNGSVQMYSASASSDGIGIGGWTELHGFQAGWGGVKTIMPYLDGFVVGLDNGYVRQWMGPTTNAATGSDANVPKTWDNNWKVLYQPGTTQSPKSDGSAFTTSQAVTAMTPFNDRPDICAGASGKGGCAGFLVGRADGSILKYNESANGAGKPGWQTLVDATQNSPVVGIVNYGKLISGNSYLPSFAFADQNGYIGKWTWTNKAYGVTAIAQPGKWGNGNEVTAVAQLGDGFVVGLKNSSMQQYQNDNWTELHDSGWSGGTGNNPVRQIIPFISDEVSGTKQSVIVGLNNGSVQAWTGSGKNWIELRGTDWQSAIAAIAPVAGSAVDIYGNAVTRDGVIVGLADGSLQQWSGAVTKNTPTGYIGDGTEPASFTGKISGTQLTVDSVTSGIIKAHTYVVGGPANGTQILPFGVFKTTGTGGAGTYVVSKSQTWPAGGTGPLVAGQSGSTLVLTLPAAYQAGVANGGQDPASLVGKSVTGTNVAASTKITAYLGNAGLPAGQYKYSVNLQSLTAAEPLTISGFPSTGEYDWTQLEGIPDNAEQDLLGPRATLADLTCDASTWRCTQKGTLQQAVDFAKTLAGKILKTSNADGYHTNTAMPDFGATGGVGSSSDPIFSDPRLQPYATGRVIPLDTYVPLSPDSWNYTLGGSPGIEFKGTVSSSTNCGTGGPTACSVLTVNTVTTPNKTLADIKSGMLLSAALTQKLLGTGLAKGTVIGAATGQPNQYLITAPTGALYVPVGQFDLTAATPPTLKVGFDLNLLAYGYIALPDSFFSYFKPSQYSLGVLFAGEVGPSIRFTAPATLAPKDFTVGSLYVPGPLGVDSFTVSAGAKLGGAVDINGLQSGVGVLPSGQSSATAYAYAVGGALFAYNTEGAPGEFQTDWNYYLDVSAQDLKNSTGFTASATLNPYVKLAYGIRAPESIPIIGGWSVVSLAAGIENPLTFSLCVDKTLGCAKSGTEKTGANASVTESSSGQLTFSAGFLSTLTSYFTYNATPISLYQIPSAVKVLA